MRKRTARGEPVAKEDQGLVERFLQQAAASKMQKTVLCTSMHQYQQVLKLVHRYAEPASVPAPGPPVAGQPNARQPAANLPEPRTMVFNHSSSSPNASGALSSEERRVRARSRKPRQRRRRYYSHTSWGRFTDMFEGKPTPRSRDAVNWTTLKTHHNFVNGPNGEGNGENPAQNEPDPLWEDSSETIDIHPSLTLDEHLPLKEGCLNAMARTRNTLLEVDEPEVASENANDPAQDGERLCAAHPSYMEHDPLDDEVDPVSGSPDSTPQETISRSSRELITAVGLLVRNILQKAVLHSRCPDLQKNAVPDEPTYLPRETEFFSWLFHLLYG